MLSNLVSMFPWMYVIFVNNFNVFFGKANGQYLRIYINR